MASGKTHLVVGAAVGLTVALADQNKHEVSHHPITALGLGAACGRLPDILEPALGNPHHRQFCHSILVLSALGAGLTTLYKWRPATKSHRLQRGLGLIAGCAYASHLLCDATTPRSLPFVGRIG